MPRRFPILQLPNRSLVVAMAAGALARSSAGSTRSRAALVSRLAMVVWAVQEVLSGANWFRRLLGVGFGARALAALGRSLHRATAAFIPGVLGLAGRLSNPGGVGRPGAGR
ncbi:MAG: hypothetical protein LC720_08270 [Actinobacteria bacterium]|nr:hypothetical protein [Actinomycetota bacterium]